MTAQEQRLAMNEVVDVIKLTRWGKLDSDQKHELIELFHRYPDIPDKQLLKEYRRIVKDEPQP